MSLDDFEGALNARYASEVNLTHAYDCQEIVDYCKFSRDDLIDRLRGYQFVSTKDSLMQDHFAFHNNVETMGYLIEKGFKKLSYIFCGEDVQKTGLVVPYVFIFPSHLLSKHHSTLVRLEKLKAFL